VAARVESLVSFGDFSESRLVHEFRTRDRVELVGELEAALATRREWVEQS
jgi:hypothetical protein